jgi:hypothetical protein
MGYKHGNRVYDPLKCQRGLFKLSEGQINSWIDQYTQSPGDWETEERLVKVARQVFELPDYDTTIHEGYMDAEVLEILDGFNRYLSKKE